tara:strand:- start:10639 stop:11025 length:387 start_codon:yes stop_codon:yes gene_type:complete
MAIITTKYAFGWFGAEGEQCESFDLSGELGTYSYSNGKLNFESGSQGFSHDKLKGFTVISLDSDHPTSWTLDSEMGRYKMSGGTGKAPELNKLECGRMYFIHNPNLTEVLIPNFIPTAIDVDMGRVNK